MRDLTKPSFNPPNWVFAPVWTMLYVMMAIAVWRILRLPDASAARRLALTLFFIQLALNAAWSWMFFGANNPLLGVINIIPQFLVILATVVGFYRLDRMAAWCLVPLAVWVAFRGRSQRRDLAVERLKPCGVAPKKEHTSFAGMLRFPLQYLSRIVTALGSI